MSTTIGKSLTIAVTVLSVLFMGVAAVMSTARTDWKQRATAEYEKGGFPKSEIAKQDKIKADLNAQIKSVDEQQVAAVKTIDADIQALTNPQNGREVQLETELAQLIDQAHTLSGQIEAEAKKVQLKQDEDTRLRDEVTRLKSQYEDLVGQKDAAQADVKRLKDLLVQAKGVLQRVQRRHKSLEAEARKSYDPEPSAGRQGPALR